MAPLPSPVASAVGRLLGFESDGPGVRRHHGSSPVDAAGVHALVELIDDDAEVAVLDDDVTRDGGKDPLAVFVPAGEKEETRKWSDAATNRTRLRPSDRWSMSHPVALLSLLLH